MTRPTADEYFLSMASVVASRATCARRHVGCILVSARRHVLATGYNGPPSRWPHCLDAPCPGANAPSGSGLDECEAIHAEQNALLQCRDVEAVVACYVTTAPCVTCTKLLLNTGCQAITYGVPYPQEGLARQLWERNGRVWSGPWHAAR